MENEFFDEPRKCPNCGIVTYCDGCPTCGRKLPRSSSGRWKRIYGRGVAGEDEGVLQPVDTGKLREHIDIRDSQSSNRVFKEATHSEPKVDFHSRYVEPKVNFSKKSVEPSHPFFDSGQVKQEKKGNNVVVITLATMLIFAIFTFLFSSGEDRFDHGYLSNDLTLQEELIGNNGEVHLTGYTFDEDSGEVTFHLENNGSRSFITDISFYSSDKLLNFENEILILPHESFEYTLYTGENPFEYSFTNYNFFQITAPEPSFYFYVYNDFGSIEVNTDDNISKEDLKTLLFYLLEASSHEEYSKMVDMIVYTSDRTYEVFIDDMQADVYMMDHEGKVEESYKIELGITTDNIKDTTL